MIFADIVGLDELPADLTLRRIAGDRQRAGPPIRRRSREPRHRAGAHAAQRLPGQLRAQRAAHRQRPPHRRFRHRDAAHHRPVQRRDRPRLRAARGHRHRHGSAADWSAGPAWPTTCGAPQSISPIRCRAVRRSPASTSRQRVYDAMRDTRQFTAAGDDHRRRRSTQPIWRLTERQS